MNGMTWVRILVGAVWLNGAAEKILNPQFPQQFAQSIKAGGYVSQAPQWFQAFMKTNVVPNAELYANLTRAKDLSLDAAISQDRPLISPLLTNRRAGGGNGQDKV